MEDKIDPTLYPALYAGAEQEAKKIHTVQEARDFILAKNSELMDAGGDPQNAAVLKATVKAQMAVAADRLKLLRRLEAERKVLLACRQCGAEEPFITRKLPAGVRMLPEGRLIGADRYVCTACWYAEWLAVEGW